MRERQDQVEILRKDIEDNQKALRDIVSCNKALCDIFLFPFAKVFCWVW